MDKKPLRVLLAEDNPSDAELILRELGRAGFKPNWHRVDTEESYASKLDPSLDIILSDYAMPQFSGLRALEILRQRQFDIPFIIVSGTIGEDVAVKAMQQGAADYLIKDRLARLGQAVEHALEQKRLEAERRGTEKRLREQAEIIDRAQDAVIVRDFSDDQITFWNRGAEQMYGWSAAEAVGQNLGELIFAESTDRKALVQRLTSAGEYHGEIKHRTKGGREIIVDSRVTLIRNDDGTPRAVLGVNTDITEQKKLETQLLRSQRLESIGTLASGVAHDLNNVLTPILMCAEVLRRQISGPGSEATIKLIEQSARRGAGIVKQVLTFARGVEGERVLIKPNHLIDEMTDIAKKTFSKSIEISSRYPEDLWMIRGDPTQLHQVLLNLSVNARDAMPKGGTLVISGENVKMDENYAATMPGAAPGAYVAIGVTDTGSGMARTTVEKIFDPFFTTKDLGKGTGLGLSTTLGIVKSHGGFISVDSEVDKGTTFKVFLPATMADEAIAPSEMPAELLQGDGELILVVDDEQSILSVTAMILESKGYRVITAHDGPEAVAIFAREMNALSAVLTDMSLPFMDGIALIRSLTKIKPSTSFIASSGQGEHVYREQLEKLGVTNLLSKPYDTQKLLEAIRNALGPKKA